MYCPLLIDPGRIRTCNPLIRSQMPYPLGHRTALLECFEMKKLFNVETNRLFAKLSKKLNFSVDFCELKTFCK